jgi:hypothetical protein
MSLQGRIAELTNRHQKLDSKIHEEMKRPAADSLQIRQLKQEKLRLKQEINDLKKAS